MSEEASILSVGEHCSLPSCNVQDFLPILCHCQTYYCRHHINPEEHDCAFTRLTSIDETLSEPSTSTLPRCSLEHCNKKVLPAFFAPQGSGVMGSPIICAECHASFCVDHRHPKSHICSGRDCGEKQQSKESKAFQALLARNGGFKATSRPRHQPKVPTDPLKLAQYKKVELIKMRHRALPGDPKHTSLSLDQRIHVKFRGGPTIKIFWFDKLTIAGRVLDLLLAMSDGISQESPLALYSVNEGDDPSKRLLQNSEPLSAQIEDGALLQISPIN